jgi:hypothetical protein
LVQLREALRCALLSPALLLPGLVVARAVRRRQALPNTHRSPIRRCDGI